MRSTTRIIVSAVVTAGLAGACIPDAAHAQQVGQPYIVAQRVLSDVAIGQPIAPSSGAPLTSDLSEVPQLPPGPGISYPSSEVVLPSEPVDGVIGADVSADPSTSGGCPEGGCASGELGDGVEQIDAGEVEVDASGRIIRGGGRLRTLVHGGEIGPHIPKQYGQPDLFYNYYSNGSNRVNAEMYLAPVPVPPFVGNTWVPYQPLMPHNYLYKHVDRYHNHYDYGRGTNRTKAHYWVSPRQYAQTFKNFIRLPR